MGCVGVVVPDAQVELSGGIKAYNLHRSGAMIEPIREQDESSSDSEPRLSEAESWALLRSMRGMLSGAFDEYGGAEAWLRKHRSDEEGPED